MFEGEGATGERLLGFSVADTAESRGTRIATTGASIQVTYVIHDVLLDGLKVVLEELQVPLKRVQGLPGVAGRLVLIDLLEEFLPVVFD